MSKTSVGDHIVKAAEYVVAFEGTARVVEVDPKASPVRILFTVKRLTKVEGSAPVDLLQPGTVIVADGSQNPSVFLEEGTLPNSTLDDATREAFQLVYSPHKPNDVTDDDIFGTKEPKRIGQSWPVNRALAVQSLKDTGIVIPDDQLSGTVSLQDRDKFGVIDCLSLRGEMTAAKISPKGLPSGLTIDDSDLKAVFRGCFPLESVGLARKEGFDMVIGIHASQAGTKFDVLVTETRDAVWTPL